MIKVSTERIRFFSQAHIRDEQTGNTERQVVKQARTPSTENSASSGGTDYTKDNGNNNEAFGQVADSRPLYTKTKRTHTHTLALGNVSRLVPSRLPSPIERSTIAVDKETRPRRSSCCREGVCRIESASFFVRVFFPTFPPTRLTTSSLLYWVSAMSMLTLKKITHVFHGHVLL